MKFDPQKSFGYPVLRPGSEDYRHSDFQSGVSLELDESDLSKYFLTYDVAVGVKELTSLISSGKAKVLLEVTCRTTFYGKVFELTKLAGKITLDAGLLKGGLEICCYVVATQAITSFSSKKINTEFGTSPISFPAFAVLACDLPTHYWVDRELFRNITSIFDYKQDDALPEGEWRLNLDEDRIEIILSPTQLAILQQAQSDKANQAVIVNSIVFGAVVEMVSTLKSSTEFDHLRWAQNIRSKSAAIGIRLSPTSSSVAIAQQLMAKPLSRLNTHFFKVD